MRIAITTLGCKVNQSESASIKGILREDGHKIVNQTDSPDVCIINTCTVTAKSDYQSRQMIRRAVKSGAKVIATGCYAQLRPAELLKIKGVDFILGNSEKEKVHEYIQRIYEKNNNSKNSVYVNSPDFNLTLKAYSSERARAFLKIQDGCNFSCSYCTVPLARGRNRSLTPDYVLQAARRFSDEGYREIVLTGIHIASYGYDLQPKSSLIAIIDKLARSFPHIRIRLSSIEPREFKNEFLELITAGIVCRHLHIPLQSGSDRILKEMNRGYTIFFYKKLIEKIITECPDISIGTDIIAGFPGEDNNAFQETVSFVEELPFSYLHVFPYSKRPNTPASDLGNQISGAVKKERVRILSEIGKKKKNNYISRYLGWELDVIVEGKTSTPGLYKAISDNYVRPFVLADCLFSGQRLSVKAINFTEGQLHSIPL